MTLGGLALAVGILVDDATVAIENINAHLEHGQGARAGDPRRRAADRRARPSSRRSASASSSCRCSSSPASPRYLFVPMAEAVVFAMLASYVLSRTLVPTMAKYLLKAHEEDRHAQRRASRNPLVRLQAGIDARLQARCAPATGALLEACLRAPARRSRALFLAALRGLASRCCPWVGEDFFPAVDTRPVQAAPARARRARASRRRRSCATASKQAIRAGHPAARDGERHRQHRAAVQRHQPRLHELGADRPVRRRHPGVARARTTARRRSTSASCACELPQRVPGRARSRSSRPTSSSQILNFGLPAPIDIQVVGAQPRGEPRGSRRRC